MHLPSLAADHSRSTASRSTSPSRRHGVGRSGQRFTVQFQATARAPGCSTATSSTTPSAGRMFGMVTAVVVQCAADRTRVRATAPRSHRPPEDPGTATPGSDAPGSDAWRYCRRTRGPAWGWRLTVEIVTVDATPTWLDRALNWAVLVTGLEQRPLGTGQMRQPPDPTDHADGTGSSLIAKFLSSDPSSRSTGCSCGPTRRRSGSPAARSDAAGEDADRARRRHRHGFRSSCCPRRPRPGGPATSCRLRPTAARPHSASWSCTLPAGATALADIEWPSVTGPGPHMMIGLLGSMWTGFVDRYRTV